MNLEPNAKRLAEAFRRIKRARFKKSPIEGVKHSEFLVLVHLNREVEDEPERKGFSISELGKLLQVKKPTVTELINNLDQNGYIERNIDPDDRRVVRIKLSNFGKEQMNKAYGEYIAFYNGLVNAIGENKSTQLVNLLEEVHHYYETIQTDKTNLK